MADAILVPANADQKKNFRDVQFGGKTFQEKFLQNLRKKQKEYTGKFQPFCFICAKTDFQDKVNSISLELERTQENFDDEEQLKQVNFEDVDNYADIKSFNLLETKPVDEQVIIEGVRMPRRAYMRHEYKCIKRSHGLTVDMPWYAWVEKQKNNEKSGKEVKDDVKKNSKV